MSRNRFANSRALAREFVTCFETHCFPLSECWKTGNEPIGKIFETVNLDNYSNRLLFLMYQVFTTEQKVSVGLRLLKIRLALRAHKRFSTLMLAPIDFLSCSGFLEKLAEGQFFTRA